MFRQSVAKVTLNFPRELLKETDNSAHELGVTRSDLIRTALVEYLKSLQEAKLKRQLIEGYKANAGLLRQVSEEFSFVDRENI